MITLFKGDDTHGQLGKKCFIKFHCDDTVDMTNVRVRFNLINIVTKEFENVHDGSELEIFISHQDARKLPLGVTHGKLWGEDSSGKIRTFANRIPFIVTTDLRKVYGSDGLDSVDVHVYASVDWESIANRPTLFPSKVSMVEGLEEALAQAGKVKTVNGRSPDENGNIEIDIPSAKVTSVNNKTGDVELTAQDIPYGGEGASNVETAIEQNTQGIVTNAEAIESLGEQLSEVKDTTYTKEEVDQKISQSEAHYLTAKVNGSFVQFATHAALAAAKAAHTEENPQFWYGDSPHTPDKNDYCTVLDDETHGHATTRYMFVGEWPNGFFRYQYTVNDTPLTEAQWRAINSLTSVDEDGNLCFDGIPFVNSSGELLFTEDDPIFTAWKNEVQIILGSGANVATGKYKQIAIGAHATANGQNAIALGSSEPAKTNGPRAMSQNAIAIGAGANATATNAVQIFAGTNNTPGTIQLGNKRLAFDEEVEVKRDRSDMFTEWTFSGDTEGLDNLHIVVKEDVEFPNSLYYNLYNGEELIEARLIPKDEQPLIIEFSDILNITATRQRILTTDDVTTNLTNPPAGKAAEAKAVKTALEGKLSTSGGLIGGSLTIQYPFEVGTGSEKRMYGVNSISKGSDHLDFPSGTGVLAKTSDVSNATKLTPVYSDEWTFSGEDAKRFEHLSCKEVRSSDPAYSHYNLYDGDKEIGSTSLSLSNLESVNGFEYTDEEGAPREWDITATRTIDHYVTANGEKILAGTIAGVFATPAFAESVATALDEQGAKNKITTLAEAAVDDKLPIALEAKTANFTAEDGKRYTVVSMPATLSVTLPSYTGDAANVAHIFEARFDGSALTADASVTFAGGTATTMDTDCGTVKAGKVALMSAFWNGATWDISWKNQG